MGKEKTEIQDPTRFVSLMVRNKKSPAKDRIGANKRDLGPCTWKVLETKPITAKTMVRFRGKRQKLLDEGKDVILTRTVLKPDDPKYGVARRVLRVQRRAFRPMQRMLHRRQQRLDAVIDEVFSVKEEKS